MALRAKKKGIWSLPQIPLNTAENLSQINLKFHLVSQQ